MTTQVRAIMAIGLRTNLCDDGHPTHGDGLAIARFTSLLTRGVDHIDALSEEENVARYGAWTCKRCGAEVREGAVHITFRAPGEDLSDAIAYATDIAGMAAFIAQQDAAWLSIPASPTGPAADIEQEVHASVRSFRLK